MKYNSVDWDLFIKEGLQMVGKPYIYGIEVNPKTPIEKIPALDCSELCEILYARRGIVIPDGSYNQWKHCRPLRLQDVKIGDLAFKWIPETKSIHHVGVLIKPTKILEAKGQKWGTILTDRIIYEASSHFAGWGRLKCFDV